MKKLLGTLLLLTLFGLIRLHWLARPGSEEISSSMHRLTSATGGLIMDLRSPAESLPNQQLAFWKREVDRILDEHPEDAELHAAAAMMFYDPCFMYASEALRETAKDDPNSLVSTPFDRVRSLRGDFDQEGSQLSTELIKRATELDSDDPRWWRLRAVLLWPSAMTSLKYKPLSSNWESVLQQAEEYDPGNALFSLIRASKLSESSIDYDSSGMLVVKDAEAWRRMFGVNQRVYCVHEVGIGGTRYPWVGSSPHALEASEGHDLGVDTLAIDCRAPTDVGISVGAKPIGHGRSCGRIGYARFAGTVAAS